MTSRTDPSTCDAVGSFIGKIDIDAPGGTAGRSSASTPSFTSISFSATISISGPPAGTIVRLGINFGHHAGLVRTNAIVASGPGPLQGGQLRLGVTRSLFRRAQILIGRELQFKTLLSLLNSFCAASLAFFACCNCNCAAGLSSDLR